MHGGSSSIAATGGAIPSSAAALFASRSAPRSISSRLVSLPGTRITYSVPPTGAEVAVRDPALERGWLALAVQARHELLDDLAQLAGST